MKLYCGQCLLDKRWRPADTMHQGTAYCASDYVTIMRIGGVVESDDELQDILAELPGRRPAD
jgi:hypothetical protein